MAQNQVAQAQILVANIGIFTQILLKKLVNFLVVKSGYQQPNQVAQAYFR